MSFKNTGKVWSLNGLSEHLKTLTPPAWAKGVTLHHTWNPNLGNRPVGHKAEYLENIAGFYREKGWGSGPHAFPDEDQVWGMTPFTEKGIHAASFNGSTIGFEALGNFDSEDPFSGRGLQVWQTTAASAKIVLDWLKVPVNSSTVKFHRDDPKTSKTCPGTKVKKDWVLGLINGSKPVVAPVVVMPAAAPVASFVTTHRGYSSADVVRLLKKRGPLFFFGEDWLEGAYYDKVAQATVAPLTELENIAHK